MSDCKECGRELLGSSEQDLGVCNACEGGNTPKTDEYDLRYAGYFSESDLLGFNAHELHKSGYPIRRITITPQQADHLLEKVGYKKRHKAHKNPLIDFWERPSETTLTSIHGIEVEIES